MSVLEQQDEELCWRYYGKTVGVTEAVYEVNHGGCATARCCSALGRWFTSLNYPLPPVAELCNFGIERLQ